MVEKTISAPSRLNGSLSVSGDKSISHRLLMLGSIASGKSVIENLSPCDDCRSTMRCLKALGVSINRDRNTHGRITIHGKGSDSLGEPSNVLNAGNSGTTARLLSGILAAQPFISIITGDKSLRSRPMKRLIDPLKLMGADIEGRSSGTLAPLVIKGSRLYGINYKIPVASAQIKSAILLASLFADSDTILYETALTRDHTERLLIQMGASITTHKNTIRISPISKQLKAMHVKVPGDFSSAAFWIVAGLIHPDASIVIKGCGLNPTRTGLIEILVKMGADIRITNRHLAANEPVADIHVRSSHLNGTEIKGAIIPRLIDEIPVLAVAACFAYGKTIVRDASELRAKESDRITTLTAELAKMGASIEELPDGMIIHGGQKLRGTTVDSHNDHRLAMSLAIAALGSRGTTTLRGSDAVSISYPEFWQHMDMLTNRI